MNGYLNFSDIRKGLYFLEDLYPEVYVVTRMGDKPGEFFAQEIGEDTGSGMRFHDKPGIEISFFGVGQAYGPVLYKAYESLQLAIKENQGVKDD